jgi:hypothetical protein
VTTPNTTAPPLLEQLGALGSLLIHDMANQACIISGNATFAQMVLADPKQVGRAVEAIAKSGERMSFILGQCADLRRRVAPELPRGDAAEAVAGLRELLSPATGWELEVTEPIHGKLLVATHWVTFAITHALKEIEADGGRARICRVQPEEDTGFLPVGCYFDLRLQWTSARGFVIEEIREQYRNFGLLSAFELIRQSGGKLEGFTPAPNHQELLLCVPYLVERPFPARPAAWSVAVH